MANMRPTVFFLLSLALLWIGMALGSRIRSRRGKAIDEESKIITVLEGSMLTLYGLLLGFTFSMAVSRYDLRKALVVKEANAIGTTWLRSGTLAEPTRTVEQSLLRQYVPVRMEFVSAGHDQVKVQDSLRRTSDLQAKLWATANNYSLDHRDAVTAIFLNTLNDSIDTSEERTAADENRIPSEAWWMLLLVGFAATVLVGLDVRARSRVLQAALPLVLAAALAMTMDMDSPRLGLIQVNQPSFDRLVQQVASTLPQGVP